MFGLPLIGMPTARRRATARTTGAALALLVLLISVAWAAERKKMQPLAREAVAQVWVGISEDELYFFRLSLSSDGTGLGGYVFAGEQPRLFRIPSWEYRPERIEMTAASLGERDSDLESLRGTLVGVAMELKVAGRGWERKLLLRRESDLEPAWKLVKSAMTGVVGQTPPE